jgi:hypothetical protein
MPCVGFELPIPASERAKIVHALDRSATVTGLDGLGPGKFEVNYILVDIRTMYFRHI